MQYGPKKEKDDDWKYVAGFFIVLFILGWFIDATGVLSNNTTPTPYATLRAGSNPKYNSYSKTAQADLTMWAQEDETLRREAVETLNGSSVSCDIKGNISMDGVRIYHMPGQEYYDATVIDESYGERWFCTEDEARAAGWRKAKK